MIGSTPPLLHTVNWRDFDALVEGLASQIKALGPLPDCIVGIARGGCVPAVALSHALGVSTFSVIAARVHSSDAVREAKSTAVVEGAMSLPTLAHRRVLLVDDVLHSGATGKACIEYLLQRDAVVVAFAALLRDTVGVESSDQLLPCETLTGQSVNAWVVFPWERRADQSESQEQGT